MNKIISKLLLLSLVCGLSFSCDEDDSGDDGVVLPTSLEFTTDISTDGSGEVTVNATAEGALYYNVYFGETSNESPIRTDDGTATHEYLASGTYNIKVQAHTGPSTYISETKAVTVEVAGTNEGYTTPESYEGMTLVWQDEFNGTSLNESDWTYEIGGHGWGNNELQYYRRENTSVQNGFLTITAKKETFQGSAYTSSRLITKGKQTFQYGRIDIRAKLPKGQGIWPALWMLGENISTVGWPKCGEIDIMEMIGGGTNNINDRTVHGTLHWDDGGHVCTCDKPNSSHVLSSGAFNDKFHVFTIIWDETQIRWFMDDILFNTINITPAHMTEFHEEFFFIFNVAVGGNWPGPPANTTVFPQQMVVDYIRVFQEN